MRCQILFAFTALVVAPPVVAAPVSNVASVKPGPAIAAIDPAKLALGRQIADALIPPGTVQKMMTQMSGMRSGMMKGMFEATPKDLGVKDGKNSDKTLRQLVREADPHFEERMAITNRVIMEELGRLMSDFEPAMKDAVARVYAKRYTLAELTDIATFFRSASGKAFAEGMMPMMSDPDYVNAMSGIGPKLMQAMPDIMEKVKKATAKLPPPTKDDAKPKPAEAPTA